MWSSILLFIQANILVLSLFLFLVLVIALSFLYLQREMKRNLANAKIIIEEKEAKIKTLEKEIDGTLKLNYQFSIEEKNTKIKTLEKEINRSRQGVVCHWLAPKEQQSAYQIKIHNDSGRKIFNLKALLPKSYEGLCEAFAIKDYLDDREVGEISFLPYRQHFAIQWQKEGFRPIIIQIQYTEEINSDPKIIDLVFDLKKVTNHFRSILEKADKLDSTELAKIIPIQK